MNQTANGSPEQRATSLIDEGNRLQAAGEVDAAEARYREASELAPQLPRAHLNIGNVLVLKGDETGAAAAFTLALELDPQYAPAYFNLGNLYLQRREAQQAIEHYRKALSIRPKFVDAEVALGNAYSQIAQFDDAAAAFGRALELQPGYAQVYVNLGNTLASLDRLPDALVTYRKALDLQPGNGRALVAAYNASLHLCDWSRREADEALLIQMIEQGAEGISPFALIGMHPVGRRAAPLQRTAGKRFAQRLLLSELAAPRLRSRSRVSARRLRIGYLSPDVFFHPVMYLLKGVLGAHDRSRYAIHLFSYGTVRDAMTQDIKGLVENFRDLADLSDAQAADAIAQDDIDILVDLGGYTEIMRLGIKARRPAPLLVNWLGYPATLGHPDMADYIVGDPVVTPLDLRGDYSETLALLPHCYLPNDRQRVVGATPSRIAAGLPAEGIVFCSFNQSSKFSPVIFRMWCRLLLEIPGSVLWLRSPPETAKPKLLDAASVEGIGPDRIIFAPAMKSNADHLGRLALADLALDTFPYTSHTTACDALWVGVPLVTILGDTFASRVAASVLNAADLGELVTPDVESCYQLAVTLARDTPRRELLRAKLLATRDSLPLFDTARFTRNLESLFDRMWQQHLAGRREPIVLQDQAAPVA